MSSVKRLENAGLVCVLMNPFGVGLIPAVISYFVLIDFPALSSFMAKVSRLLTPSMS
jgi:hypothetical protein